MRRFKGTPKEVADAISRLGVMEQVQEISAEVEILSQGIPEEFLGPEDRMPKVTPEEYISQHQTYYFKCLSCGKKTDSSGVCEECSSQERLLRDSLLSEELKPIVDCKWCRDGRDLMLGQSCPNCGKVGEYKTID